jgi:hypothetical protein
MQRNPLTVTHTGVLHRCTREYRPCATKASELISILFISDYFPFERIHGRVSTRASHTAVTCSRVSCDQMEDTKGKENTHTHTSKSHHQRNRQWHQGKYRLQIPCFPRCPALRSRRPPMCDPPPLARAAQLLLPPLPSPPPAGACWNGMEWNPMRAPIIIIGLPSHPMSTPSDGRDGHGHFTLTPVAFSCQRPARFQAKGGRTRACRRGERREFRQPGKGVLAQFSGSLLAGLSADPMGRRACVRP